MEQIDSLHVKEIQREYTRIDKDWLALHYRISIGMVLFAFAVECIMGVVMVNSDMLTTTVPRYILKFIVAPSIMNLICIAIDTAAMRSKKVPQKMKVYTISFVNAMICFILFTVHSVFTATYYIFSAAIILTIIYANYYVAFFTTLISISLLVISEVFIFWDADKSSILENTFRLSDFVVALFILLALSVICMVVIRYEQKKNKASIRIEEEGLLLQQRLRMDELTGIFNRKALHDAMMNLEDCNPDQKCIFAVIDVDEFKRINDNWGHQTGDRCLIKFAELLRENCGKAIPFRYGGDEFCLLFHNTDIEEAVHTCEQIQTKLRRLNIEADPKPEVTASFGLAEYSDRINAAQLFVRADQALYKAKVFRNKIQVFD